MLLIDIAEYVWLQDSLHCPSLYLNTLPNLKQYQSPFARHNGVPDSIQINISLSLLSMKNEKGWMKSGVLAYNANIESRPVS